VLSVLLCNELEIYMQLLPLVEFRLPNVENLSTGHRMVDLFKAYIDPSITWDTVSWLKSVTSLPVVVKGILAGKARTLLSRFA